MAELIMGELISQSRFFFLKTCVHPGERLHYEANALTSECDVAFAIDDVRSAIFREMTFRSGNTEWEVSLSLDHGVSREVRVGHFATKKEAMSWFEKTFQ